MTTPCRSLLLPGLLLLVSACGSRGEEPPGPPAPGSPYALALSFVAAVPAEDPKGWTDQLEQPHDASEYGWEEGIRLALIEVQDVRFEVVRPPAAPGAGDGRTSVVVRMTSSGPKERTAEASLDYVRQGSEWRLTVESMLRVFEEAQAVATGVPRNVHMTWLLVHLLDYKISARPLELAMQGFDRRYPEGWHEIVDADPSYPLSEKGEPLDAWGRPLHYEVKRDGTYDLRSAGEDGVFHTADDVTAKRPQPE